MNAVPQSDEHITPPLPNGRTPTRHSRLAIGRGHERAIPLVSSKSRDDDRATQHPFANPRKGARNRGQSERDSGKINGAHSAIESNPERQAQTEQESSLNNSADDDGVSSIAGERHARSHRIAQSLRQHFKGCIAEWTWEHYLCGATSALMTFLLVLELF